MAKIVEARLALSHAVAKPVGIRYSQFGLRPSRVERCKSPEDGSYTVVVMKNPLASRFLGLLAFVGCVSVIGGTHFFCMFVCCNNVGMCVHSFL